MSKQTARPTATTAIDAKLVNHYKPVGIAALAAAAMCKSASSNVVTKKGK